MRTSLSFLLVLVLIPGLFACGGGGGTSDAGGFTFDTGDSTTSPDGGGTTTDVPEGTDTDVASVPDGIDPDGIDPDGIEPSDVDPTDGDGGSGEPDGDGGSGEPDADVSTVISCETDDDCTGKLEDKGFALSCEGQSGSTLVVHEACTDGACEWQATRVDCCSDDDNCIDDFNLGPCETAQCVDHQCETSDIEGCCTSNADCEAFGDGCCTTAFCGLESTCQVTEKEGCCAASVDCDDGVDVTTDTCTVACEEDGCLNIATGCGDATYYVNKNFDDGTLQLLVSSDPNPGDDVGIEPVKGNAVSPKYAVYFGDPTCETYYNGPMTDCVPDSPFATDSTPIDLKLETAQFALSAESGSYLGFWLKMSAEPPVSVDFGDGPILLDTDYLSVSVTGTSGTEVIWKSTDPDALGADNTTAGAWTHQAANLSGYAGQAITVTFRFFTDGANNYNIAVGSESWTGVYLDEIRITSTCADESCEGIGDTCPNDGNGCTQDICTPYALGSGGVCAYPTASPGQDCAGCGVAADCGDDPCLNYDCDSGICSATVEPSCCEPSSAFPASNQGVELEGFESGGLTGWTIDDPYPDDNIGWQVTPVLTHDGIFSLYFGDPTVFNYVAEPTNPAIATIWTPTFEVPAESFQVPMASFWLWMSTEYDGAVESPDPSDSYDRLSVHLQPAGVGETVELWNSVSTVHNSTAGKWVQVGVNLSGYEGTDARLGFKFDSGDAPGTAVANSAGGVRIDSLTVATACGQDPCMSATDCVDDDPCTVEYCDLGTCASYVEDENCCFVDDDCEDDNECTVNECIEGTCNNYYDESSSTKLNCCPTNGADWIGEYVATFEEGDDDFATIDDTSPVVWSVTGEFGANGSSSSYNFSDPASGTYSNPAGGASFGSLVSAPILVPPLTKGNPYAEFMLFMETEWDVNDPESFVGALNIDELTVSVATDVNGDGVIDVDSATPWWTSEYLQNTTRGEWVQTRLDLDAFRGQHIQLVFHFTTDDGTANNFQGPYVDDITFGSTCLTTAAVHCIYGGDCSPQDDCKNVQCSNDFKCVQVPKSTPECCEPFTTPDLTMGFEGDVPAWTNTACEAEGGLDDPESVWQITDEEGAAGIPPKGGEGLLYFGNGDNYGGEGYASCDSVTSPAFELAPDVPWTVRIWMWLDVGKSQGCIGAEPIWSDTFIITVVDVDTGEETLLWDKLADAECNDYYVDNGSLNHWNNYDIDMSMWAGKNIQLSFAFDTYDTLENSGAGIGVDMIEFTQGCPEIP